MESRRDLSRSRALCESTSDHEQSGCPTGVIATTGRNRFLVVTIHLLLTECSSRRAYRGRMRGYRWNLHEADAPVLNGYLPLPWVTRRTKVAGTSTMESEQIQEMLREFRRIGYHVDAAG